MPVDMSHQPGLTNDLWGECIAEVTLMVSTEHRYTGQPEGVPLVVGWAKVKDPNTVHPRPLVRVKISREDIQKIYGDQYNALMQANRYFGRINQPATLKCWMRWRGPDKYWEVTQFRY